MVDTNTRPQIHIAFLVHTCMFIVLALVVNPVIVLYLGKAGDGREETPRERPEELLELQEHRGEELPDPQEHRGPLIKSSQCQEAIRTTFTSQYIAGLAFVITAFVKQSEISYYHLRIIYSIISMHSTIGMMSNYERQSLLRALASSTGSFKRKILSSEMIDFAFLLNLGLLNCFAVFTLVRRDACLRTCYPKDLLTCVGSIIASLALLCIAIRKNGKHSPLGYVAFALCVSGYVVFQSWQFQSLTRTFQPIQVIPGAPSEKVFSFGQILVLFMIGPLICDYTAALMSDIRQIRRREGQPETLTAIFITFFSVLLPWFTSRVWNDFSGKVDAALAPLLRRGAAQITRTAATIKKFPSWIRSTFVAKLNIPIFKRSNTSRLERGEAESSQNSTVGLTNNGDGIAISVSVKDSDIIREPPSMKKRSTYPLAQDDETRPIPNLVTSIQ